MKDTSILANSEFRAKLDQWIAASIEYCINHYEPIRVYEAMWVCKSHGIQCRFDVKGCGQDIDMGRINFETDGKGNVTCARVG